MLDSSTRRRCVVLGVALLAMVAAAVTGWQFAGVPPQKPGDVSPRVRLAILPFDDPASELDDAFNRALAEAFAIALAGADPETFVVVGPATTARMLAAGLTPEQVASRADAALLLSGGHQETDHSTYVQLVAAAGNEQLFARDFDIDESAPAIAPPEGRRGDCGGGQAMARLRPLKTRGPRPGRSCRSSAALGERCGGVGLPPRSPGP